MSSDLRQMFVQVTKGALCDKASDKPHEDFKINGQYVNTPDKGLVGIPFLAAREGGSRFPAIAWMRGKIKAGSRNYDILGRLDFMATFAQLAGVSLPTNDREGRPTVFDGYDMSPVLFGTGKCARNSWFYFTEDELSPGAVRVGNYQAIFNLRDDDGQDTGGLAVDSNPRIQRPEQICGHRSADIRPLAGPRRNDTTCI